MVDTDGTQAPEPPQPFNDPVSDSRGQARPGGAGAPAGDVEIAQPVTPDPATVRRLVDAALAAEGESPGGRPSSSGRLGAPGSGAAGRPTTGAAHDDGSLASGAAEPMGAGASDASAHLAGLARTEAGDGTGPPGGTGTGTSAAAHLSSGLGSVARIGTGAGARTGADPESGVRPESGVDTESGVRPGSAVGADAGAGAGAGDDAVGQQQGSAATGGGDSGAGAPEADRGIAEDDDEPTAEIPRQPGAAEAVAARRLPPLLRLRGRTATGTSGAARPAGIVRKPSSGSAGLAVALVLLVIFILIAIQFVVSFVESVTGIFG